MSDQINFKKRANPQHLGIRQSSIITYTLSNLTAFQITSAIIHEPLLSISSIVINALDNCKINTLDSTLIVTLPQDGLKKNEEATCSIQLITTNKTQPSDTLYSTAAMVSATVGTPPYPTLTESASAKILLNSASLTIKNTVSPSDSYYPGETVHYTIEIINSGNQTANIAPGQFIDSWSPHRLTNFVLSDNILFANDTRITNTGTIKIEKNSSVIYTISATVI